MAMSSFFLAKIELKSLKEPPRRASGRKSPIFEIRHFSDFWHRSAHRGRRPDGVHLGASPLRWRG